MTEVVVAWRLMKFVGLSLLVVGAVGPAFSDSRADRARLYKVAVVGWACTWIAGYGLLEQQGLNLSEPWVRSGLFWSAVAVTASLAAIERPAASGVATFALFAGLVSMLHRAWAWPWMAVGVVPCVVLMAIGGQRKSEGTVPSTRTWFRGTAWVQASLWLVVLVAYLAGVSGWFAWVHGVVLIVYWVALLRWVFERNLSLRSRVAALLIGGLAAFVPLGSVFYERRSCFGRP